MVPVPPPALHCSARVGVGEVRHGVLCGHVCLTAVAVQWPWSRCMGWVALSLCRPLLVLVGATRHVSPISVPCRCVHVRVGVCVVVCVGSDMFTRGHTQTISLLAVLARPLHSLTPAHMHTHLRHRSPHLRCDPPPDGHAVARAQGLAAAAERGAGGWCDLAIGRQKEWVEVTRQRGLGRPSRPERATGQQSVRTPFLSRRSSALTRIPTHPLTACTTASVAFIVIRS